MKKRFYNLFAYLFALILLFNVVVTIPPFDEDIPETEIIYQEENESDSETSPMCEDDYNKTNI